MKNTPGGQGNFSRHVSAAHRGSGPPLIQSPKRTSRPWFSSGQRKLKWREQALSRTDISGEQAAEPIIHRFFQILLAT